MIIVAISDTHCRLRKMDVPEGDLLLHSGDLTFNGDIPEISQELRELGRISKRFKKTILVCGNHDWLGERNPALMREMCEAEGITYLDHESTTFENLNIFGSAYQPEFCSWAFNLPRGGALKEKWSQIPENTNILITHGPPYEILDMCPDGRFVGCVDLMNRIDTLKDLKLHVFGHIHYSNGHTYKYGKTFVNSASLDERYKVIKKPYKIIKLENNEFVVEE